MERRSHPRSVDEAQLESLELLLGTTVDYELEIARLRFELAIAERELADACSTVIEILRERS